MPILTCCGISAACIAGCTVPTYTLGGGVALAVTMILRFFFCYCPCMFMSIYDCNHEYWSEWGLMALDGVHLL